MQCSAICHAYRAETFGIRIQSNRVALNFPLFEKTSCLTSSSRTKTVEAVSLLGFCLNRTFEEIDLHL
jgi:hypothetical protein